VGIETMVSLYQTTYTALPVPQAGRVKLASVALRRARLASELTAVGTRFIHVPELQSIAIAS
jgi:NADPH-dependent 2,4-dienoyl-CoA reductase/sulfur reductase-like enzyme